MLLKSCHTEYNKRILGRRGNCLSGLQSELSNVRFQYDIVVLSKPVDNLIVATPVIPGTRSAHPSTATSGHKSQHKNSI